MDKWNKVFLIMYVGFVGLSWKAWMGSWRGVLFSQPKGVGIDSLCLKPSTPLTCYFFDS